jgi:hypothetical protein
MSCRGKNHTKDEEHGGRNDSGATTNSIYQDTKEQHAKYLADQIRVR